MRCTLIGSSDPPMDSAKDPLQTAPTLQGFPHLMDLHEADPDTTLIVFDGGDAAKYGADGLGNDAVGPPPRLVLAAHREGLAAA